MSQLWLDTRLLVAGVSHLSGLEAWCQEPAFTDDFKIYFSVQLPHLPSFKSLFSRSLIIETRQNDSLVTQVHGDKA